MCIYISHGLLAKSRQHTVGTQYRYICSEQYTDEPAKVAEFEDARLCIEKKVLRFDVSVADSVGMDVGQRAEQLVHVHL